MQVVNGLCSLEILSFSLVNAEFFQQGPRRFVNTLVNRET